MTAQNLSLEAETTLKMRADSALLSRRCSVMPLRQFSNAPWYYVAVREKGMVTRKFSAREIIQDIREILVKIC